MELFKRLMKDTTTRNKLLLVIMILFITFIGYRIPIPGIDTNYLRLMFADSPLAAGFLNILTGNSLSHMSIFALSISPYISASIVLQLLGAFVPAIERIQKDGAVGKQKMERLTFLVGALIAIIESLFMAIGLGQKGLFIEYTWYMVLLTVVIWTVGACVLIWIGQFITNKLIGNGISMILLFNILSSMPDSLGSTFTYLTNGKNTWISIAIAVAMVVVGLLLIAYVVVMNEGEKRIHLSNSNQSSGISGANDNIMPLRVNMGGVMPIIFSSAIMSAPAMIAQLFNVNSESVAGTIIGCFNQANWFQWEKPIYNIGILIFIPLTFVFSYFYSEISFNTHDIAENLKKSGGIINGIRPGEPTAEYLDKQVKRILLIGTTMLVVIALIPTVISGIFSIPNLSFGGTTIIIVVGVLLEMKNTIIAQTSSVAYKSLLKKSSRKRLGRGGR